MDDPSEYQQVVHKHNVRAAQEESSEGATVDDGSMRKYDPWGVLGLKPGASPNDIRLRYHDLLREVHPDYVKEGNGDINRLNDVNKAYEIITKSPSIDKRYRHMVSDTQHLYYKFLPEWMARNID